MAITRILPEDVEVFTLETNPPRTYSSGSLTGVTGNVYVFPRRSTIEKEVHPLSMFSGSLHFDVDINGFIKQAKLESTLSGNNSASMGSYMAAVNAQASSLRKQQFVEILRFTPGVSLNKDFFRKWAVQNVLFPFYRADYPTAHYAYNNYHSLNFFSASSVPSSSVLLYPQTITSGAISGSITGSYIFSGSFSFDFWINPRYTTDTPNSGAFAASYQAGTVFHLSSCYAVSIVTGSSVDSNGFPDKFRILLQLSSAAGIAPSSINLGSLPAFAFASADNSLRKNTWHHVTARWGTSGYNNGTGSIMIDEVNRGNFVVPSASVTPSAFIATGNPSVLCIGNFYEGTNTGADNMSYFFTTDTAQREGLTELLPGTGFEPGAYRFSHPLNAEVHELKIYNKYLVESEIATLRSGSLASPLANVLFYLPPFFTREAPTRTYYNGSGGVLTTPFFTKNGTSLHPFAVEMAYDVGGHYINLENFVRDFATSKYPRLLNLTGSAVTVPNSFPQTANDILYSTGSNRRRASTILPNDNGYFYPNFDLLSGLVTSSFVNDLRNSVPGLITLRDMIPTSSIFKGLLNTATGSIGHDLIGPDPELSASLGTAPGRTLTILQRTRDNTSNQVVFFDISNLFYGNAIQPGTFILTDSSMSGTNGKVKITLRDDKHGNLFRADATGSYPTWNSVGNIFYSEGIVVLKSPHLFFFGQDSFQMSFNGTQNLHVLRINTYARALMETSSSNPSYIPVSASDAANETDQKYVYITGINLHDDNMNIIVRTNLAQPLAKRTGDKFKIPIKLDF